MTTQAINSTTPSLIELGAAKLATFSATRRQARADRRPRGVVSFIGEMLGTLAALACFVVAAFALGFIIGMAVAGVALLLLDFKASMIRRARAAQRRGRP